MHESVCKELTKKHVGEGTQSTVATRKTKQAVGTDGAIEHAGPHRAEKSFVHKALPTPARTFKGHVVQF